MKFAQILNLESLSLVPKPEVTEPPLNNIDPKDIPEEAAKVLTPNLEEDNKEKEIEDPFPEEYVPTNLTMLQSTTEALIYTSDISEENMNLLQASLDVVKEDSDISPLSMTSIIAQMRVAADTSSVENTELVRKLAGELTADSPYRYQSTVEAMGKTIGNMRPIIIRGLHPLIICNNYLDKSIDMRVITEGLQGAHQLMTPTQRQGEDEVKNNIQYYKDIVEMAQDNISPEQIPGAILAKSNTDINIPVSACATISKGIQAIELAESREVKNTDIVSLIQFFTSLINIQKAMEALLTSVKEPLNVQTMDEVSLVNASNNLKHLTGLFWSEVVKCPSVTNPETKDREFQTMRDWNTLILKDTGKSGKIELGGNVKYGYISEKTISDLISFTLSDIVPKFKTIIKNSGVLSQKAQELETLANQVFANQLALSDESGLVFQKTFFRVLDASKFVSNFTLMAINTFSSLTKAYTEISKGIGILGETK